MRRKIIEIINLNTSLKTPPVLHRLYFACSFLRGGGLVCLANLGGSCLHSGGSWRAGGFPLSLVWFVGIHF